MAKEKLYIVGEIGWEYDDNNYNCRGHSDAILAFRNKEKAEAYAEEKNLDTFKGLILSGEIRHYDSYDIYNLIDLDKANSKQIFQKIFGCDPVYWFKNRNIAPIIVPTKKDYKELYECFETSWYYVSEIEMKG